nr:wall-associated receptor kinase 2-like [Ipomoea trifida]
MSCFLVLLLVLSAVLGRFAPTAATLESNHPIAKPNCKDHCGSVSIPFPFGLTPECYLNSSFFINCDNSNGHLPKPFLRRSNVEVKRISIEGQLNIKSYIAKRCYNKSEYKSRLRLPTFISRRSPSEPLQIFVNQTGNKFVAVGCDTFGYVYGYGDDGSYKTEGCMATCSNTQEVQDGSCSGFGCCETGIPNAARNVYVSVDSLYYYANTTGVIPCSYVFVVQKEEFNFSTTLLTNENWYLEREQPLTMVLDWAISEQTCSEACLGNTTCLPINGTTKRLGYRCACMEGYEGNPYLSPGCQDIDECNGKNNCSKNSVCINTEGGYECSCIKGYHGDGMGALGCIIISANNHQPIGLVLGIALGTIALLITVFCVYLGYRKRKSILMKEKFFMENGGMILQQKIAQGSTSSGTTRIFTSEELKRATNNYDKTRIIGQGGFGIVYKGHLFDGRIIAVKKAKMMDPTQVEQFINENQLFKILDANIVCGENTDELQEVALLAKRCLNVKGEDRPTMKEVAVELSGLRRAAKHPWTNNSETSMESEALLTEQPIPVGYDATFSITTTEYDSLKHHMEFPVAAGR